MTGNKGAETEGRALLLRNLAKRRPSPSMYDEWGYTNWFGGFHRQTDRETYLRLLGLILRRPWNPAYRRLGARYLWRRWVHRACDTTDFHHDIYCTLDPWVRRRDREREYVKVWEGHWPQRGGFSDG